MPNRIIKKINSLAFEYLYVKKSHITLPQSLVSFTFDDIPASAAETGAKILNDNNIKGTFYISFGIENSNYQLDEIFNQSHIKQLISSGHELGCHTYHHIDYSPSSLKAFNDDLKKNKYTLNSISPSYQFKSFSYPGGNKSYRIKKIVSKKYQSSRSTTHGINSNNIDFNNLKAIKLYENKYSLKFIFQLIDSLRQEKGWIIFYTHDIKPDFSDFGCSPQYFKEIVNYCKNSQANLLSVNEAYQFIQNTQE